MTIIRLVFNWPYFFGYIVNFDEQSQTQITKYLQGEKIQAVSSLGFDSLDPKFDPKSAARIRLEELESNTFESNGFPEKCFGCGLFRNYKTCEQTKVHGPRGADERILLKIVRRCSRGGCDTARKQFVENLGRLKTLGKAQIDLEVRITRQHIPISNYGADPTDIASMMQSNFLSDEYELKAAPLKPSITTNTGQPDRFGSFADQFLANMRAENAWSNISYDDLIPEPVRLQHELDEFIESETQMNAYGESVWA